MDSHRLFNLERIDASLSRFQAEFAEINARLSFHREEFTDILRTNIMAAYGFLNGLLEKGIELFSPAGLHSMLELNHTVLCGTDTVTRYQYHNHILETRKRYLEHIRPIRAWVLARYDSLDPYQLATEFYCRSLSRPQLFIEGNHRTENIILNYILLSKRCPPFVICPETAHSYLELSGGIKMRGDSTVRERWYFTPRRKRRFAEFLRGAVSDDFLLSASEEGR